MLNFSNSKKKVFLVEPQTESLKLVRNFFQDINAVISVFGSLAEAMRSGSPDLVVMMMPRDKSKFEEEVAFWNRHPLGTTIPMILIAPFGAARPAEEALANIHTCFTMPVEKVPFLRHVADCLGIPPRRVFRIIVTVSEPESPVRYSGISVDFSESGMSFECNNEFGIGSKVGVRFVNPKSREKLFLVAEIVRRSGNPSNTMFFYGVRFEKPGTVEAEALRDFVRG